jgi:colanic acid biosynthesis glycosyl transferase WcaI
MVRVPLKIVFVNRFFHPDISATSQMLSDLAFDLAGRRDVHVIASRLTYESQGLALPRHERIGNTSVHRVWTSRFGRGSLAGRALDYLTFYLSATARLLFLAKPGDVIVSLTDPPLMSVPASWAARLTGARLVNWLHDLFPEIAGELDFKRLPKPILAALAWLRDRSLAAAMANVTLGDVMAARLRARGIAGLNIRVIHNWASGADIAPLPPGLNSLRRLWGLDGKFVVGYSGNMGRAHDFDAIVAAARRLASRADIVFLLVGGGKQRDAIEASVREHGLSNVIFRPYQPREMLRESLAAADCHVVSLKPSVEGLMTPSKIYSSLAAGRPIVFIGAADGEIAMMLHGAPPFGVRVAPDDVDALVKAIELLCDHPDTAAAQGRRSRELFEERYDKPVAIGHWAALLDEADAARVQAPC